MLPFAASLNTAVTGPLIVAVPGKPSSVPAPVPVNVPV
jgi:hypothetical protein